MTPHRLTTAVLLLLASPWAPAHPGHGQGLGHIHRSLAQALAEWPATVAALAISMGLLVGLWAWRQDRADQRLQSTLGQRPGDGPSDLQPPN